MAFYLYKKFKARQAGSQPMDDLVENPSTNDIKGKSGALDTSTSHKQHEMRRYRYRRIAGLFFPAVVYALNMTIIAGALPFIASDFNQFSQLNWIVSAYNLTSAVFIPAFAQYADTFGRYPVFQAAGVLMITGSAVCAGAPTSNWPMLLAGRGIQGAGAAGMLILEKVILADKVSLKENATNNTLFTFVSGVGYGIGPVIGGYLTQANWRWCFIINIPLSVAGLILTHFITREELLGPPNTAATTCLGRLRTLDFVGQSLFFSGGCLFVLALTWAGSYYPWSDVRVIAPLTIGVFLLCIFAVWEYLLLPSHYLNNHLPHQRPLIPLNLVFTRNAGGLMYINLITGMAMYAVLYFSSLYFTIVQNFNSSKAGTSLLYYTPGLAVGAYLAMLVCNIYPRKTWPALSFGSVIEALGVTLLAAAMSWGELPTIYGMLGLTGVGTAIRLMPNTLHGVGYYRKHIASIVSLMGTAHAFGGTLASTIMLNIFNNLLRKDGIAFGATSASSFSAIEQLTGEEQDRLRLKAKDSIVVAFYAITSFLWLGVVAVAFMGNVNVKKHGKETDVYEDGETDSSSLTKGSYLGSVMHRRN